MNFKNLCFFLLLSGWGLKGFSQDIIFKNDKSEVKAKVLEILDREIKYKKWDFMEGPTYSMRKNEIFMIIYENGRRETFNKRTDQPEGTPTPATKSLPEVNSPDTVLFLPKTIYRTKEPLPVANTEEVEEKILPVASSRYIFTPRDKSISKSRANRTEGHRLVGLRVNVLPEGVAGGVGISYGADSYKWRNNLGLHTDFEFGGGNYTKTDDAVFISFSIGPTYAFNNLLKIDKERAALFGGVYFRGAYMHGIGYGDDYPSTNILFGTIGFRGGGSLIFRKKAGIFGEVRSDGYGTAYKVGVSLLLLKKN